MTAMAAILDFRSEWFRCLDLLVTPMLPIKFQDNRPFVSGEAKKKKKEKKKKKKIFKMAAILDFSSEQF